MSITQVETTAPPPTELQHDDADRRSVTIVLELDMYVDADADLDMLIDVASAGAASMMRRADPGADYSGGMCWWDAREMSQAVEMSDFVDLLAQSVMPARLDPVLDALWHAISSKYDRRALGSASERRARMRATSGESNPSRGDA